MDSTEFTPDAAADSFETSFRERQPFWWFITLVGPFLLTGAILAAVYFIRGPRIMWSLLVTALITFFALGKFAILFGADASVAEHTRQVEFLTRTYEIHIPTIPELFLLLVFMDLITACLLACHTSFLFRLPWLGGKLQALTEDGHFILQSHPWMRRATFLGLVAFVVFPLAATGSIGGSIFGRLMGMSRIVTFLGVCIGSVLGCALMVAVSLAVPRRYLDPNNPLFFWGGIVVIAGIVVLLNFRYRQAKKRYLARQKQNTPL